MSRRIQPLIEVTVSRSETSLSSHRRPKRLEADQDLPDTATDAVEKPGVQLQPEVSESGRAGNRLRAAHHRQDLPERRASAHIEQILQQQPDAHTDHEYAVAVQEIGAHLAPPRGGRADHLPTG